MTVGTPTRRILDPLSRVSEILFGVIMALTFTTTIDAAAGGREDMRLLIYAVIGCNLAWGLVDAAMFLMSALTQRGRGLIAIHAIRGARRVGKAHRIIADTLPAVLAPVFTEDDLERLRLAVLRLDHPPQRPALTREDWLGAAGVCLLVLVSTFPIVVPLLVIGDGRLALRASNTVAIALLFGCGFVLARHAGYR